MRCAHGMEGRICVHRGCPNYDGGTDPSTGHAPKSRPHHCSTPGCGRPTRNGLCTECRRFESYVRRLAGEFEIDTDVARRVLEEAEGHLQGARHALRRSA